METTPAPAAESAETGATSVAEILSTRNAEPKTPAAEAAPQTAEAPPAPEPSAQPAPKAETPPAPAAAASPEPTPDPSKQGPKWYRDHMAKVNREAAALRQENERLRTSAPQPQRQQHEQRGPAIPDPIEDPQGYHEAITGHFNRQLADFQLQTTLTLSERFARSQHGNETFEETRAWLTTRPDLEDYFTRQPDPWGAAISHFTRERLAEEIGDDPSAYRAKIEAEIRAKVEAEFQERQGASGMTAQTQQQQHRAAPPAPASTARSAAPRDPSGRFTGPAPLGDIFAGRQARGR